MTWFMNGWPLDLPTQSFDIFEGWYPFLLRMSPMFDSEHYPLRQVLVGQVGLVCKHFFEEVGERSVPHVVEKGGYPQLLDVVVVEPGPVGDRLPDQARHVHRPDHMLEPAVHAARIDEVGSCELVDPAEALDEDASL